MGKRQQQVRAQRQQLADVRALLEGGGIPAKRFRLVSPYDVRLHAAIVSALDHAIDEAPPSVLESGALVVDLEAWATAVVDELVRWWPT